jgi:hypothetical protein
MRSLAIAVSQVQLIVMFIVVAYAPSRRPLFLYVTRIAEADACAAQANGTAVVLTAEGTPSTLAQREVFAPALFMVPALLGAMHGFASARLVEAAQVTLDAPYGDHGITESLGWETGFWAFVGAQHALVQCVMCSPLDALALAGAVFALTVLLLVFCTVAANAEGGSPSHRLEFFVVMLICLLFLLMGAQTSVELDKGLAVWTVHVLLQRMLVGGHLHDNPVTFTTVLNCRWAYTLLACCLNIVLYFVY